MVDDEAGRMSERDDPRARVAALEEQVRMLVVPARLDDDREPYTSELLRRGVHGDRLTALNLTVAAVLAKASGREVGRPTALLLPHADLDATYTDTPTTVDGTVRLVADVIGVAPEVARALLAAHERAGLGRAGHAAPGARIGTADGRPGTSGQRPLVSPAVQTSGAEPAAGPARPTAASRAGCRASRRRTCACGPGHRRCRGGTGWYWRGWP